MKEDSIVHFVCFDTTLDIAPFMRRWEDYKRSANSDADVTMQQSVKKDSFRYIAQHYCTAGELRFSFTKSARRSPHHAAQINITEHEAGGYSILQAERKGSLRAGENKIFVFVHSAQADVDAYRGLSVHGKLNIYSAYYENCRYAFIMEYFTPKEYTGALTEQLSQFRDVEIGVYKQYAMQKDWL